MKTLLTTLLVAATALFTQAQTATTPVKTPSAEAATLVSKIPDPKLVIDRQATGNAEEGSSKFAKTAKSVPAGSTLSLANGGMNLPSKGNVNVVVLTYSFAEAEASCTYNQVILKKAEVFGLETIIADMKAAGYRPATAEQVSAVRRELAGKKALDDILLRVFGTVLKHGDNVYTMGVDYHYVMGTDILAYGDGMSKVGFYGDTEWCKHRLYLAAIKIDEGLNEKQDDSADKSTEKPSKNKKKK